MTKVKLETVCEILDSQRIPVTASERKKGIYPYYGANGLQDYVDSYIFDDELILLAEDGGNFNSKTKPIAYRVSGKCWVNNHAHVLKAKEGNDVDFLCYALMFYDVSSLIKGATRKKLTQKDMREMLIPLYPLEKQKDLANKLGEVDNIIAKRKQQLKKLDLLVKAKFYEMFGEVGTDQKSWGLVALGNCCEINPKKNNDLRITDGLAVSFVPMTAIGEKGEFDGSEMKIYERVQKGFTYFAENDVLFAKITPCMENGKGAVARGLYNGIGFGSTEFHILRPLDGISNSEWLYSISSSKKFRQEAAKEMTGSAGQRRVPANFLISYKVALPPIELQNEFAHFVEQTEKIKSKIKQSLEKLELLKQSLLQKYFG